MWQEAYWSYCSTVGGSHRWNWALFTDSRAGPSRDQVTHAWGLYPGGTASTDPELHYGNNRWLLKLRAVKSWHQGCMTELHYVTGIAWQTWQGTAAIGFARAQNAKQERFVWRSLRETNKLETQPNKWACPRTQNAIDQAVLFRVNSAVRNYRFENLAK